MGLVDIPTPVTGLCPECQITEVAGVEGLDGSKRYGVCSGCTEAVAEKARAAEEAKRRAKLDSEKGERRRNIRKLLIECGVDAGSDHLDATLDNFDPRPDREALEAARQFVDRFQAGERPTLFLYSERPRESVAPGGGKSHLATAILRELLLSGDVVPASARHVRETRMTITIRGQLNPGGRPENYVDDLIRRELLILDDVGKAKTDSAYFRELLFELIAGREPRATIITSNHSPGDLEGRDEWYAPLLSRILGKGPAVCLTGPDRRLGGRTAARQLRAVL